MSRNLNHGFEDKCSEETFNEIYNMAFVRGKNAEKNRIYERLNEEIKRQELVSNICQ